MVMVSAERQALNAALDHSHFLEHQLSAARQQLVALRAENARLRHQMRRIQGMVNSGPPAADEDCGSQMTHQAEPEAMCGRGPGDPVCGPGCEKDEISPPR